MPTTVRAILLPDGRRIACSDGVTVTVTPDHALATVVNGSLVSTPASQVALGDSMLDDTGAVRSVISVTSGNAPIKYVLATPTGSALVASDNSTGAILVSTMCGTNGSAPFEEHLATWRNEHSFLWVGP